ncbi:MAG: aldehyde dehydrogenase family protein [Rhizobiaceae bacterium]
MDSQRDSNSAAGAGMFVDGRMLIAGRLAEAVDGGWLESRNPANGLLIGRVPAAGAADAALAVEAAAAAQRKWAALSVEERGRHLLAFCDRLLERSDEILRVEVADTGNTITPMRNDLKSGIERLRYFVGLGYELKGQSVPSTPNNLHFTIREPYGVVARILAFNHPIYFALCGIGAPLMAGNAIILKPSEQSPLSASIFAEVAAEILPPGIVGVLTGGREAGEALARHPGVKRLSFVGSARTGMAIQRAAADVAVKHVTLELGGKNPFIVFPDASIEKAAAAAVSGMNFGWQGQSCGSTSRLIVHESIHDRLMDAVVEKVRAIRVGDPFDEASQMGPINSAPQYEKVLGFIDTAGKEGARLMAGGARPQGDMFRAGYWIEPTVFGDVRPGTRLAQEEVFGPILSVMRWSDEDEMIRIANGVDLGLTAAVWTNDITRALTTARRLESGYVWVNGVGAHVRGMPYGGYKNSGTGRERGIEEMMSYTEEKAIHIML